MRAATSPTWSGIPLVLAMALCGCGKVKQNDPAEAGKARAEAKRQKAACASSGAYDRLKGLIFDQAIGAHNDGRANLDTLADYSFARMEDPVVSGWDPALDITQCRGHFILEMPPGAERAFGGERRLQADLDYTAQAAADGSGFVYRLKGAEPIVAKLAAFNLTSGAYRPPAAIDDQQAEPESAAPVAIARADVPALVPRAAPTQSTPVARQKPVPRAEQQKRAPERSSEVVAAEPRSSLPARSIGEAGEATVRAFYAALGAGDGATASAQIIPEKRSGRAYSPEAISRFYGRLPEPLRLTGVVPLAPGAYRVSYRYSAGRSHCAGSAVVRLSNRDGRDLIRSIDALSGC